MNRIWQYILPVVIIAGVSWFVYNYFNENSEIEAKDLFVALPENSPFILEVKDIRSILNIIERDNSIHNSLSKISSYKEFFENVFFIDSLIRNDNESGLNEFNQTFVVTSEISVRNNPDYLFITQFSNKKRLNSANKLLMSFKNDTSKIRISKLDGVEISQIYLKSGEEFFFAIHKGFLIISKNKFLVESSIKQLASSQSLLTNKNFKSITETAGKNSLLNLYINHKYFPEYLSNFINKSYSDNIEDLKHYSDWSEFDLTLKDKELFLNGFSFSSEEDKYLNIFNNQQPVNYNIQDVLPESTSLFAAYGISDLIKFKQDLRKYQSQRHTINNIEDKLANIKRLYKIDLEELIYPLIDNEIAYVITEMYGPEISDNAYAVLKTNSTSISIDNMLKILKGHANKNSKELTSYINEIKVDQLVSYTIYSLPFPDLAELLFGEVYSGVECNYFTFIDNYIILGKSVNSIKDFLDNSRLNNNLLKDISYVKFSGQLTGKSNFYFYCAPARSTYWFSKYLSSKEFADPDNLSLFMQDFHALSFQFSSSKKEGVVINDFYLKHDPVFTDKPHTVWEVGLDTNIAMKPALLKNYNNNVKEIFVQDLGNKIYYISHKGTKIWEKVIDEQIISEVYLVDYYKNGKYQFLFNTANKIYILDINGNFVERYPVNLNSPATTGLSLCDYEDNKDYRIFVPCKNKNVYLYTIDGNIVDGWKFKGTEHDVNSQVQHFLVDNSDYIVFNDNNKSYFLDRRGKQRFNPKINFENSQNGIYILNKKAGKNNSELVITSPDGTINHVDLKGNVTRDKIRSFSENHFFDFQDMDGDGSKDYIFVDENKLEVYTLSGKKIIDYTFSSNITNKPVYYEFPGNNKKLGIVDSITNELFLINSDGTLYDGFPLYGKTLFSIGSLKLNRKFNLFVGTNNNLLYNYEVK